MSEIVHVVHYPHSPSVIWRALTTRELLSEWLMPTDDFEPVLQHAFQFRAPKMPGWDGIIHCRVLEITPTSRLVWEWRGSNMRNPTRVTFELSAEGAGTRLSLKHDGFRGFGGFLLSRMHSGGWKGKFLGRLLPALLEKMER